MGGDYVLCIDQGTTSTKALLLDPSSLEVVATGSCPVAISSPQPGWVEQDASELWQSVIAAIAGAVAGGLADRVAAIAVSNQRESVVAWDGATGTPVAPVLSWQDQRGVALCQLLDNDYNRALIRRKTGLELSAMYSAPKLRWLVEEVGSAPGLRFGTVDSWLLDRLTNGGTYAVEAGNASRTLLFDIANLGWDGDLCALFGVPISVLPEVRPSTGPWGNVENVPGLPNGIPILAVLGDSHAALYGHWALSPEHRGTGKATYGTGSSVMLPTTDGHARRDGVSTTLAWHAEQPVWAYEANILYSGAGLDWLGRVLGVAGGRGLSELAAGCSSSDGAVFVPALNGLGAPWWEPEAVGTITGLSVSTGRAEIARAGLESVAHQICDVLDVMDPQCEVTAIHAGGGATASDLLMQTQANLLGRELLVAAVADISPLGVGAMAAGQLGIRAQSKAAAPRRFAPDPQFSAERRATERARWRDALGRAGVRTNQSTSRL